VDKTARVIFGPELAMHHGALRGGRRVGARRSRGVATRLGWTPLLLVD
jgi:hypothetical protein